MIRSTLRKSPTTFLPEPVVAVPHIRRLLAWTGKICRFYETHGAPKFRSGGRGRLSGIVAALASSSVGAAFGYDAGSLIRQRREGRSPPAGQWTVLLMLGFVVAFIAVVVMLAIVDAMLFA